MLLRPVVIKVKSLLKFCQVNRRGLQRWSDRLKFSILVPAAIAVAGCSNGLQSTDQLNAKVEELVSAPIERAGQVSDVTFNAGVSQAALLRQAVEASDAHRTASLRVEQAIDDVRVAQSGRRPRLTGQMNAGGVNEFGGTSPDEYAGAALTLTMSQLVYDGGYQVGSINKASAQLVLAQTDLEVTNNEIAVKVASAWVDVWQYSQRAALLQSRKDQMGVLVDQLERMSMNGMSDRSMVEGARRKNIELSAEISRVQTSLVGARRELSRYFGSVPNGNVPLVSLGSLSDLRRGMNDWQNAPQLRRSAAEVVLAAIGVDVAHSAFAPTASLRATLSSPMNVDDSSSLSVGVMVDYTFSDGGRRQAALDSAEANHEVLQSSFADQKLQLQNDVQLAIDQIVATDRLIELTRQQLALSEEQLRTSRSQLSTGQSTVRQLLDAEIENFQLQERIISLRAERAKLFVGAGAQTGQLWRLLKDS